MTGRWGRSAAGDGVGEQRINRAGAAPGEIDADHINPPVARQPRGGTLTVAQLCAAAIEHSDNAAANLLLNTVGGPRGVTAYVRGLGDTRSKVAGARSGIAGSPRPPRPNTSSA